MLVEVEAAIDSQRLGNSLLSQVILVFVGYSVDNFVNTLDRFLPFHHILSRLDAVEVQLNLKLGPFVFW